MFSVTEITTSLGTVQYRREYLTGLTCRISPGRLKRGIDQPLSLPAQPPGCPFCPENVFRVTPAFPDGSRICRGESVTFPNLYPFGRQHVVTVITREHFTETFSRQQIVDALSGQTEALRRVEGFASINWNFLPSAGASLIHPHMQGLCDPVPSKIVERYLQACRLYRKKRAGNYWDAVREGEKGSDRYLFGDEIVWSAHAVPVGEREIRGILPVATLVDMDCYTDLVARGILEVLSFYRRLGTHAFNMSLFFDQPGSGSDFSAFCSIISRINPGPAATGDTAFMERLHLEPVVLTFPEELGRYYRQEK